MLALNFSARAVAWPRYPGSRTRSAHHHRRKRRQNGDTTHLRRRDLGIDEEKRHVIWTRSTFGGNIMAQILCPEKRPQIGTVRSKVFKKPPMDETSTGEIIKFDPKTDPGLNRIKFLREEIPEGVVCNLEEAGYIVSGGRCLGQPENFEDLANALGGIVAPHAQQ